MADHSTPSQSVAEFDAEQPHDLWRTLRGTCPVSRVSDGGAMVRPTYIVSTWAGAKQVLLDPETFSSSINAEGTARFMGPVLLGMDGERHRSRRQLISHAFRASQLARWEETLIRPIITALCDSIAHRGSAELMEELISRFPVQVICGMCAIPSQDSPRFLQWAKDIHRGMRDEGMGRAAAEAMRIYLEPLVEARRRERGDDLISDIVHAEVDGERLDDEEVFGFLRLLLPAGSESTYRAIGSALLAILSTPGLYARVMQDRSILPSIVEETLRWDVSNSMVSRVVTRDTLIEGCPVPAGAGLRVVTNSANRDEKRFAQSDTFDLERPAKPHIGFGLGPHQCLGQPLARMEMRVGLDVMLARLNNLSLDPAHPSPVVAGASFRGPPKLHVLFEKA
ncbi:cytochrome P450 [Sphingobium sufflavum]|uniref:cytochrome P450 n=1 Tax=Sphingobium sufflavum TaxID=1129547 RepID=UPI001F2EC3C2|nr:cytochrome P450 [Sphingobium sufflavum]MCE7798070.1 cytochrome P450 [Sphingobium sufflavum]